MDFCFKSLLTKQVTIFAMWVCPPLDFSLKQIMELSKDIEVRDRVISCFPAGGLPPLRVGHRYAGAGVKRVCVSCMSGTFCGVFCNLLASRYILSNYPLQTYTSPSSCSNAGMGLFRGPVWLELLGKPISSDLPGVCNHPPLLRWAMYFAFWSCHCVLVLKKFLLCLIFWLFWSRWIPLFSHFQWEVMTFFFFLMP